MVWRPFYFANLIVDPKNPDRLFKTDGALIMSEDAGKSFSAVGGFQGAHGDVHDVWIDPSNPQTVFNSHDCGMWYSYNGGSKWWKAQELAVSQFYHVSVDADKRPFRVYGGLQDNSCWVGMSEFPGGIANSQWENLYGGDGFHTFPDRPRSRLRLRRIPEGRHRRTNQSLHARGAQYFSPRLTYKEKLRFNWNTPMAVSAYGRRELYLSGAQFLFRSRDHGRESWDRISPILTTNDPEKQKQEREIGWCHDRQLGRGNAHHDLCDQLESPKDKLVIWVGTRSRRQRSAHAGVTVERPGNQCSRQHLWFTRETRGSAGSTLSNVDPETTRLCHPLTGIPWVTWLPTSIGTPDFGATWGSGTL